MCKLLRAGHGSFYPFLRTHFKAPKFLSQISQFHSPRETLAPNPKLDFIVHEVKELQSSKHSKPTNIITQFSPGADEPPDRGRSGLLRKLSRKDIQIISRCGCPSLDRKVVNSGKRLRAYVDVDEGDACA